MIQRFRKSLEPRQCQSASVVAMLNAKKVATVVSPDKTTTQVEKESEEAGPSVNFHQILHSTHAVDFSNGRVCNLSEMESRYSSFDRDNTFLYLAA